MVFMKNNARRTKGADELKKDIKAFKSWNCFW